MRAARTSAASGDQGATVARAAMPAVRGEHDIADLRFRTLVGDGPWSRLPEAVRRRFSKRLAPGEAAVYRGHVVATELSPAGRVLAFVARLIGGPLPMTDGATGAAVVTVTEDAALGGQVWTRTYARPGRFPQVVHSAKRFCGPTGLEEYVGRGVGMTLSVTVEHEALVFRSERYFLELGRRRAYLSSRLAPGRMEIVHREEPALAADGGGFSFRLTLTHPVLGRLLFQHALFRDA